MKLLSRGVLIKMDIEGVAFATMVKVSLGRVTCLRRRGLIAQVGLPSWWPTGCMWASKLWYAACRLPLPTVTLLFPSLLLLLALALGDRVAQWEGDRFPELHICQGSKVFILREQQGRQSGC